MSRCHDRGFPDVTNGAPCCYGSAFDGPGACTCWEETYDLEQAELQEGAPAVRDRPCHDCAYLPKSPERTGQEGYALNGDGELEDLAGSRDARFFCHQGSRRVIAYQHPSGAVHRPGRGFYYGSPIRGEVAYKADGAPQDICAGFAALRRKLLGPMVGEL